MTGPTRRDSGSAIRPVPTTELDGAEGRIRMQGDQALHLVDDGGVVGEQPVVPVAELSAVADVLDDATGRGAGRRGRRGGAHGCCLRFLDGVCRAWMVLLAWEQAPHSTTRATPMTAGVLTARWR
ncbi:hypothetical protein QBA36_25775 [Streptomyces stelliscabiei]